MILLMLVHFVAHCIWFFCIFTDIVIRFYILSSLKNIKISERLVTFRKLLTNFMCVFFLCSGDPLSCVLKQQTLERGIRPIYGDVLSSFMNRSGADLNPNLFPRAKTDIQCFV